MNNNLRLRKELLIRKSTGKEYLNKYLQELNLLCNIKVNAHDLISLENTEDLINKYNSSDKSIKKEIIKFNEKGRLKSIIEKISLANEAIYLITEYSKFCGAIKLGNANLFNTDFRFEDEHAGIITICSEDVKDRIILDYFEEEEKMLEIELEGNRWFLL